MTEKAEEKSQATMRSWPALHGGSGQQVPGPEVEDPGPEVEDPGPPL